jgi:hypothetical protein
MMRGPAAWSWVHGGPAHGTGGRGEANGGLTGARAVAERRHDGGGGRRLFELDA